MNILSERIDYERSIENQMEMINQQNHEIESLRGEFFNEVVFK